MFSFCSFRALASNKKTQSGSSSSSSHFSFRRPPVQEALSELAKIEFQLTDEQILKNQQEQQEGRKVTSILPRVTFRESLMSHRKSPLSLFRHNPSGVTLYSGMSPSEPLIVERMMVQDPFDVTTVTSSAMPRISGLDSRRFDPVLNQNVMPFLSFQPLMMSTLPLLTSGSPMSRPGVMPFNRPLLRFKRSLASPHLESDVQGDVSRSHEMSSVRTRRSFTGQTNVRDDVGRSHDVEEITGGYEARMGEYPWIALLGKKLSSGG